MIQHKRDNRKERSEKRAEKVKQCIWALMSFLLRETYLFLAFPSRVKKEKALFLSLEGWKHLNYVSIIPYFCGKGYYSPVELNDSLKMP